MPFVEKLVIHGGHPLRGDVQVRGGKNTSLAVLSAALLCDEPVTLENLPDIEDVHVLLELMRRLGARIQRSGRNATIDPRQLTSHRPAPELCRKLRGSYYLLGALLGRVGEGAIPYPGGCEIGARPIDQHIKGFRALGAEVDDRYGMVEARTTGLVGTEVFLDCVTVGGTINVMLAAARAQATP